MAKNSSAKGAQQLSHEAPDRARPKAIHKKPLGMETATIVLTSHRPAAAFFSHASRKPSNPTAKYFSP